MAFNFGDFSNRKISDEQFKKSSEDLEKRHQENVKNFFNNDFSFENINSDFETFRTNLRSPSNSSHPNSFSKLSDDPFSKSYINVSSLDKTYPIKGTVWEPKSMPENVGSQEEWVSEVVTKEWNLLEAQGNLKELTPEKKVELKKEMYSLANAIYNNLPVKNKELFETQIKSYKIGKTSLHALWVHSLSKEELEKVQSNASKYDDI